MGTTGDRQAIAETLYRFAAGLDEKNAEMFGDVFTVDAIHDFSRGAKAMGMEFAPILGREAIVGAFLPALEQQTTSHTITNIRVQLDGDRAQALTLTDATHLTRPDHDRKVFAKNRYMIDLEREGETWRISHLIIENVWWEGDLGVLTGAL
jgi:3-phenylpropionate/cinnamic acid dioxygenase small subunit